MRVRAAPVIRWGARGAGVAFAVFLSLFALDAESVVGCLIRIIPSLPILAAVAAGWWRAWLGAVAFGVLTVAGVWFFEWDGRVLEPLILIGPVIVVSVLFLVQWRLERPPKVAMSSTIC